MATTDVLQFFREIEPAFKNESDDDLIEFIGATQKDFLDEDPEFKQAYQDTLKSRMGSAPIATVVAPVAESGELALKGAFKGALDVFASVPKSIALGASAIDKLRGKDTPPEEFVTYQLGEIVREAAEEKFPIDDQARDTWSSKIGQGLGSAAGFLAGGAASRAAGAGLTGIAALGSSATSNEFYEDAKRSGADEDTAFRAAALGAGVGLTELIPLNRILNRIPGSQAVGFKKTILDAVISGAEEAAQENLQSALQNVTAQQLGYDPDRGVFEGFEDATAVGGATGGILSLLASGLGRVRGPRRSVAPEGEQPSTTPQTDEALQESAPQEFVEEAERINQAEVEREIPEAPTAPAEEAVPSLEAQPVTSETEPTTETRSVEEISETAPVESPVTEEAPTRFEVTEDMTPEQVSTIETANKLTDEVSDLNNQVDALTTQLESLQSTFPIAKETPDSMREYQSRLKSQQRGLELKRKELEVKQTQALDAASKIVEDQVISNVEKEPPSPFAEVVTDPAAERSGLFIVGAVDPTLRPLLSYKGGKLSFNVDSLFSFGDRFRERLFGGKPKDAANRATNFVKTQAAGLKNSADTLVKAFESNLTKVFVDSTGKKLPVEQRNIAPLDELLRDKDVIKKVDLDKFAKRLFAHRGENYTLTETDKQLARDVIGNLDQARKMIDYLSKKMIDSGIVADKDKATFDEAIGEYLTRSYKVFNKSYDWNWDTIPTAIRDAAVKDILSTVNSKKKNQDNPITEQEAIEIAREMTTDRDSTFEWTMGLSSIRGIPVRLLYKRKQLSKPIRELLGEIKDPVTNTLLTLDKQINLLMGFQQQNQIAELMVESGIASHEEDKSKGFTQQIFQDNFALGIQSKRKYPSLRPLYTTPNYARELQSFFIRQNIDSELGWIKRNLKKLAGITKYNLVILNPAAYSTQYIAAAVNEVKQGRLLWPNYAAGIGLIDATVINSKALSMLMKNRKLRKSGKNIPTLQDQDNFLNLKGSDLLNNPSKFISDNSILLEDLAYRYGALSDNVDLRYIEETLINQREKDVLKDLTARRMWSGLGKRLDKETIKSLSLIKGLKATGKALTKAYGGGDAAGKMNAFLVETIGEATSNPDATLEDIMVVAAQKTMATTPTPSTIAPSIKEASSLSLLNAFISWQIELVRNTYNQGAIASKEITSANPVDRARGYRRAVSGMALISAAVAGGRTMLEALMGWLGSNDDEYTTEAGDWISENLLPPWDENQSTAVVKFDEKGFAYNPLSYILPDALLGVPFKAAMKGDSFGDALTKMADSLKDTVGGLHPLVQALQILIQNYDPTRGIKVANTELPMRDQMIKRATESGLAIAPGIVKTLTRKLPRIISDGKKPFGREYSVEEELMSYIGIRTYGYEWEGALRGQMQNFERRVREAKRIVPKRDLDELIAAGKPEEAKALQDKEDARIQAIAKEYSDLYVGALKYVPGLTRKQLDKWQRNITDTVGGARLSKDLTDPAAKAAKAAGY